MTPFLTLCFSQRYAPSKFSSVSLILIGKWNLGNGIWQNNMDTFYFRCNSVFHVQNYLIFPGILIIFVPTVHWVSRPARILLASEISDSQPSFFLGRFLNNGIRCNGMRANSLVLKRSRQFHIVCSTPTSIQRRGRICTIRHTRTDNMAIL